MHTYNDQNKSNLVYYTKNPQYPNYENSRAIFHPALADKRKTNMYRNFGVNERGCVLLSVLLALLIMTLIALIVVSILYSEERKNISMITSGTGAAVVPVAAAVVPAPAVAQPVIPPVTAAIPVVAPAVAPAAVAQPASVIIPPPVAPVAAQPIQT